MACVPSAAAKAALAEATRLWPSRSRVSDGICGDASHQARARDHNTGNAVDITHDPAHGVDCHHLAESLRRRGLAGLEQRVTYLIWNRQIASAAKGWVWRTYDGSNPHTKHLHVSLDHTMRDDVSPWWTPPTPKVDDMTPAQEAQLAEVRKRVDHTNSELRTIKQMLTDLNARLEKSHPGA